ncbi:MAG: hypothetical protein WCL11_24895, partial [Verrucomicrobiota bacterium]
MNVVNSGNLRPLKAGWRALLALMWLAAAGPAMPLPGHSAPSEDQIAAAPSAAAAKTAISPLKPGLRVALYHGPGTGGKGPPNLKQQINDGTRSSVREVSPEEIRGGVL